MDYNVLIVEDDHNIAELLQMYLEKEGCTVTVAGDGGEGLRQFRAVHPDIVLLDVMMPVMDGWSVCKAIRSESQVPVIMLTAKVVTEINGQKSAQLMFVVGTDENGLYNPDWRENMKFALKLQEKIDERYPDLMRYVNLRKNRFNGHTTRGSLIIEVGSSGNSLGEAKYGIRLAMECVADFLNGLK